MFAITLQVFYQCLVHGRRGPRQEGAIYVCLWGNYIHLDSSPDMWFVLPWPETQLGPSLHCVYRKLHKGLCMESIWGCVSLGYGDRWGAASSSALICQTAGRGSCLFPQGVSNKRGTFPSLERKQTQIDDVMAFLGKRGKRFSDVLAELLSCSCGWGWYGKEKYIYGESKRCTPTIPPLSLAPQTGMTGTMPAWLHHRPLGLEERERVQPPYLADEDTELKEAKDFNQQSRQSYS